MTSGVLGHGIAIAVGLALAARIGAASQGAPHRVYVLLGDGEPAGGRGVGGHDAKFGLAELVAIGPGRRAA
jgi:transketolase N-terminal domain/subunit